MAVNDHGEGKLVSWGVFPGVLIGAATGLREGKIVSDKLEK